MIGSRFGRLVVVEQAESRVSHKRWLCRCDCGKTTIVWQLSLRRSTTKSCGCLKDETVRRRWAAYREPAFWARVDKKGQNECWPWLGAIGRGGYGIVGFEGKHWRTHRLAWVLTNGLIPKGIKVCHACDNAPCCNPRHLFLGSQADNMADMTKKGRRIGTQAGVNNGRAKLTMTQVRAIRKKYVSGSSTQQVLADYYGVSQFAISNIVRNKRYVE